MDSFRPRPSRALLGGGPTQGRRAGPLGRGGLVVGLVVVYDTAMRTKAVRVCVRCSSEFHPQGGRGPRQFCSPRCYLLNRWGERDPGVCRTCGAPLPLGKRSRRFCSVPCRVKAQVGSRRDCQPIPYGKDGVYLARRQPHHPHADSHGYVMEHRLVMEGVIGRFLTPEELVHHEDENPRNNAASNLRIMSAAEHTRHHHLGKPRNRRAALPG